MDRINKIPTSTACCRYTTLIFNVFFLLTGVSVMIMAGIVVGKFSDSRIEIILFYMIGFII